MSGTQQPAPPAPATPVTANPVTKNTLLVEVNGVEYTFSVPNMKDELELGAHMRAIRREYAPGTYGEEEGLDYTTVLYFRGCALMEKRLVRCSDAWPYSQDEKTGKPYVDHRNFPEERVMEVGQVALEYQQQLADFREKRARNNKPPGNQAVATGEILPPAAV